MVAASPFTRPSTPRLSKKTDRRVSHCPGRISTDSLNASPYRSARAPRVRTDPRGATAATATRPYISQAITMPPTASTRAMMPGVLQMPCAVGGLPTTGDRKLENRESMMRKAPAATEPTASRIIGTVITSGDSCGWGICGSAKAGAAPAPPRTPFSSQRALPNQVISMTRVM
jgi:hypothetical protein